MHYLGSKARHAAAIMEFTLAKRRDDQVYVEPFVGGANVMNKVPQGAGRIGADVNKHMIALFRALQNGWVPPEKMSKAEYNTIRRKPDDYPPELVAFVATGLSFGSMWFGDYVNEPARCRQSRDSCLRDLPGLMGVDFRCVSYDELEIPPRSLIYCDPPYFNTTGYTGAKRVIKVGDAHNNEWKANKFWKWADQRVDEGHDVFVSEYQGPPASNYPFAAVPGRKEAGDRCAALQRDKTSTQEQIFEAMAEINRLDALSRQNAENMAARWKCVWEKETTTIINNSESTGGSARVERLFHREA